MNTKTKAAVITLLASLTAFAENGTGLQTSIAVDIVGQAGVGGTPNSTNQLQVRGAEALFYGPIDHNFDGLMSFAAHAEGGIPSVSLHEATVGSTKLIPRSRFRIGQYFLGFGRLNQFHQHDWPFITAPKVHQTFFAKEGVLDTGVEYTYLLPVPFFLELTGGVTNGFIFGHDHSAGARPAIPTHYLRTVTYASLPGDGGSQIGVNYVGRKANDGTQMTLFGVDVTAKWKEATVTQFLFQSEVWHRALSGRSSPTENSLGFYLYPQAYLGENIFAGLRFDYFSILNQKDAFGTPLTNYEMSFIPTLTYRSSEFAQFRLAYSYSPSNVAGSSRTSHLVEAQAVILLGAHPAHDF